MFIYDLQEAVPSGSSPNNHSSSVQVAPYFLESSNNVCDSSHTDSIFAALKQLPVKIFAIADKSWLKSKELLTFDGCLKGLGHCNHDVGAKNLFRDNKSKKQKRKRKLGFTQWSQQVSKCWKTSGVDRCATSIKGHLRWKVQVQREGRKSPPGFCGQLFALSQLPDVRLLGLCKQLREINWKKVCGNSCVVKSLTVLPYPD